MSAQRLAVVLDPHGRGFGGTERVDAEQARQGAVVHCDGLRDLAQPDQLEPVQALGAGLVLVDLRQLGVDRGVAGEDPVDVGEPEEPASAVHHCVD